MKDDGLSRSKEKEYRNISALRTEPPSSERVGSDWRIDAVGCTQVAGFTGPWRRVSSRRLSRQYDRADAVAGNHTSGT